MMRIKSYNESGFSLVSVMIAAGIMGGLSLVMLNLFDQMEDMNRRMASISDEADLKALTDQILSNSNFCRVSLAGEGPKGSPTNPVTFKKNDIDEDSEGLEVELWLSDQIGENRTSKKLSSTDTTVSKMGKLKIKAIKLLLPNAPGANYSPSLGHSDFGEIKLTFKKKVNKTNYRDKILTFPLTVNLKTAPGGESTLLGCSTTNSQSGGLDWDSCYTKNVSLAKGDIQTVTCNNPNEKVTDSICFPQGTQDGASYCELLPNGIKVRADRDPWGAKIKCCAPR